MENNDPSGPLAALAGFGILILVVYLVVTAGMIALGVWIQYTITWRAMRRGLREFYYPGAGKAGTTVAPTDGGPRGS